MRYPSENSIDAQFVDDIPNGVLIQCVECKHNQEDTSEFGTITLCEGCGKELHYRDVWSW